MSENSIFKFVRDDGEVLELTSPWGIYAVTGLAYPDISFDSEPYAFEDGSYWTKNQAEKRIISFSAKYRMPDVHYAARDKVGQFFNHMADYEFYIDFCGKNAYFLGKVTDFQIPLQRDDSMPTFDLEFTSVNPFIQSASNFGKNLNEVFPKIHFPSHYTANETRPYSVRAFAQNVKIVNDGIVDTGFVASITFAEDTSTFKIQNGSGKKLDITKTFHAGDVLQIDTSAKIARLNGVKFYKGISNDSEFFALKPGDNYISYSAAVGESTMNIDIYYRSQRVVF